MAAVDTLVDAPLAEAALVLPADLVDAASVGAPVLVRGPAPGPVILLLDLDVYTASS